ncbi:MAG TPA: hypothetical protein PKJ33_02490 [Alphaproteobacteria bacterium]|nr:hypothetical protein [Alphaproteobacteria bacterium]
MRRIFTICYLSFIVFSIGAGYAADEKFFYCGPGYVLNTTSKVDGVTAYECKKLWCRDLENGKTMGNADLAASGYKSTSSPAELCDAENTCVTCFGDRKWCSGESAGVWNPDYGAYTRGGADTATYGSYQKGSCYTWRLEKPTSCASDETSVLKNGEWICAKSVGSNTGIYSSSIRRTGSAGRLVK